MKRVAVVGGGWAGLAAAVRATEAGHRVTLLEMAPQLGGRARSLSEDDEDEPLDNGQHILIGAYVRTLALMRTVGARPEAALLRCPLVLRYPDGRGLSLPGGPAIPAFVRGVLACRDWSWRDKLALLGAAGAWAARGFRCAPGLTVAGLCARLPGPVRTLLIDPLCVAALNTSADHASATVFLRVLHDALFSGAGSADLLLPMRPLQALLPSPAQAWLTQHGAELRCGVRLQNLDRSGGAWDTEQGRFDAVVLACSATEAARLAQAHAGAWAQQAAQLRYEPIITVYLHCPGARLPTPMTALLESDTAPAQFVFDHGALGAAPGRFAMVVSGAQRWAERGLQATTAAAIEQAQSAFPPGTWPAPPTPLRTIIEKRATFSCTPGLRRPPAEIAPGLWAAGDYVAGPYPATLEGAVRAGEYAARQLA